MTDLCPDLWNPEKQNRNIAVWVITPGGLFLAPSLLEGLGPADLFVCENLSVSYPIPESAVLFRNLARTLAMAFNHYSGHVLIFATGIAVRLVAPLLKSKLHDPAVVVLDDRGIHAISLVSGHIGGANDLTLRVSRSCGARPVITTATDVNGIPAIDTLARQWGLVIENPGTIKAVNMAFLQQRQVDLFDPLCILGPCLPEGCITLRNSAADVNCPGIVCTDRLENVPRGTLTLRPRSLAVGIGCKRGTSQAEISAGIKAIFHAQGLTCHSIGLLASADIKQDEQGLLAAAHERSLKISLYSKQELNSVTLIQNPSTLVEQHLGVKSVCEAAAILASGNRPLIVPKQKTGNMTLAVARIDPGCLSLVSGQEIPATSLPAPWICSGNRKS